MDPPRLKRSRLSEGWISHFWLSAFPEAVHESVAALLPLTAAQFATEHRQPPDWSRTIAGVRACRIPLAQPLRTPAGYVGPNLEYVTVEKPVSPGIMFCIW